MRRLAGVLVAACLALPGCGDSGTGSSLDDSLGYFPRDAGAVFAISTDLDTEQWQAFDEKLAPDLFDGMGLEEMLRETTEDFGSEEEPFSYEEDVEPLLGNQLVVGTPSSRPIRTRDADPGDAPLLAALDANDGEKLRELARRFELEKTGQTNGAELYGSGGESFAAIEGDVLVVAEGEGILKEALARRDGGERLTEDRFEEGLAGLPDDSLVRGYGDLSSALETADLRPLLELEWFSALGTFGASAGFDGDQRLRVDAILNTDADGLTEADLPLAAGDESPAIIESDTEVSGASRDQSQTTVFLLRAVRAAFPNSDFVRDVATVERELDIDFEKEVLEQFNGPSASLLSREGGFAARSEVADAERMSRTLRRLYPNLGKLVQDLDSLRTEGLSILLLLAPDAPVSTSVLGDSPVKVRPVRGERDLYRISNLPQPDPSAGVPPEANFPPDIWFGLIDGVFVVASTEERAREIARSDPAEKLDGVTGASVTRANLAFHRDRITEFLDVDLGRLGEYRGWLHATPERLRGSATIELR
jgi:Protein of unknown function (DUF3352)